MSKISKSLKVQRAFNSAFYEHCRVHAGKILTFIDSVITFPAQNKAVKDVVRGYLRENSDRVSGDFNSILDAYRKSLGEEIEGSPRTNYYFDASYLFKENNLNDSDVNEIA